MTPTRRLALILAGLALITGIATIGYVLVEGLSWVDALYMTVITVSTVGFGEVVPLSPAGKLFTIGLILTAVGMVFYMLTTAAEILVAGRLRDLFPGRSMQNQIDQLRDHVIVCGFGRIGQVVADELRRNNVPIVIVESDPGKERELEKAALPFLIESAVSDDALARAGIAHARAIVIATGSDADNLFIALAAREANADIHIHSRAETDAAARRLRMVGAHQVISPYRMGGIRMAQSILRPAVVDFLELARPRFGAEVDLEEIQVASQCELVGESMAAIERRFPRVRIVALRRGEESVQIMPSEDTQLADGDHLVVIGEHESLSRLAHLAGAAG